MQATTGIVVAGTRAQRTAGPVIAVVEDLERLAPMMRAAERIARATGGDARLWLLGQDRATQDWAEGQIRLALGAEPAVGFDVIDMTRHSPGDVAGLMRREGAGFVISRFGGRLTPTDADAARLRRTARRAVVPGALKAGPCLAELALSPVSA